MGQSKALIKLCSSFISGSQKKENLRFEFDSSTATVKELAEFVYAKEAKFGRNITIDNVLVYDTSLAVDVRVEMEDLIQPNGVYSVNVRRLMTMSRHASGLVEISNALVRLFYIDDEYSTDPDHFRFEFDSSTATVKELAEFVCAKEAKLGRNLTIDNVLVYDASLAVDVRAELEDLVQPFGVYSIKVRRARSSTNLAIELSSNNVEQFANDGSAGVGGEGGNNTLVSGNRRRRQLHERDENLPPVCHNRIIVVYVAGVNN